MKQADILIPAPVARTPCPSSQRKCPPCDDACTSGRDCPADPPAWPRRVASDEVLFVDGGTFKARAVKHYKAVAALPRLTVQPMESALRFAPGAIVRWRRPSLIYKVGRWLHRWAWWMVAAAAVTFGTVCVAEHLYRAAVFIGVVLLGCIGAALPGLFSMLWREIRATARTVLDMLDDLREWMGRPSPWER